jgi:hypothetical protein
MEALRFANGIHHLLFKEQVSNNIRIGYSSVIPARQEIIE